MLSRRGIPTAMHPLVRLWRICLVRMRQRYLRTMIECGDEDIGHLYDELALLPYQIKNYEHGVAQYRIRLIDAESELRDLGAKP